MSVRIGLIGYGAIGRPVARAIQEGKAGDAVLAAVLVRNPEKVQDRLPCPVTSDLEQFLAQKPDWAVEVAGQPALRAYAEAILGRGVNLMTASAGGFADDTLRERLVAVAQRAGTRIFLPSAAIVGMDGVGAAAIGEVESVTHIMRKPPRAWYGTDAEQRFDLESLKEPALVFKGPAREAGLRYPQNANVITCTSLTGIGLDRTQAEIWADPNITQNTNEIVVRGEAGEFRVFIRSNPSAENPKTGRLTALGVTKAIRNLTSTLVLGV